MCHPGFLRDHVPNDLAYLQGGGISADIDLRTRSVGVQQVLHSLEDAFHALVVVGEDRQQDLPGLVSEREISAHPPRVSGPAWRNRRNSMSEAESVNLSFIGCGIDVHVPPVHPQAWSHEGSLLALHMLGIGRQSKKLGLPLRDGRRLIGTRESHRRLSDFDLKRRRRAAQHGRSDVGIDNRDMSDIGEVLME